MGSLIDENSDRSNPDYFANATDEVGRTAHANRELMNSIMRKAGFHRHPTEWWHFSIGDQMWALAERKLHNIEKVNAVYGRVP